MSVFFWLAMVVVLIHVPTKSALAAVLASCNEVLAYLFGCHLLPSSMDILVLEFLYTLWGFFGKDKQKPDDQECSLRVNAMLRNLFDFFSVQPFLKL